MSFHSIEFYKENCFLRTYMLNKSHDVIKECSVTLQTMRILCLGTQQIDVEFYSVIEQTPRSLEVKKIDLD